MIMNVYLTVHMPMKKPNVYVDLTLQTTYNPTLAGTDRPLLFCCHSAYFPCDTDLNFDPIIGSILMQTSLFTFHRWPVINKHEEIVLS